MRFFACIILLLQSIILQAQNPLYIPPAITGTVFNLQVQSGSKVFYGNTQTPTFGINGVWMCPTIIVNKGDSVTLNVINNLPVRTTMHWHGLHISAVNDGGPHLIINPGTTWSPSFKIRNNASTFWYHPHGAGQTDPQVSKGLAGLFIVKDSAEAKLNLPRTYGIDDIPIIVQSKAFDEMKQIAIASDMDTAIFVNGTLYPYMDAPAQVMRFRLLNGSSLRSYYFGFSNNETFYQIATDGGLLDSSMPLKRVRISPGERAEILINFTGRSGDSVYLKSFASELPKGIIGADSVGNNTELIPEYDENFLNGADFNILRLNITSPTTGAITSIPQALIPYIPFDKNTSTFERRIVMDTIRLLPADKPNRAEGPFGMNNKTFDMDRIDDIVYLNTTETWNLVNKSLVAHPFHIHDIQFNIVERSGKAPLLSDKGWKDVVLVMPNDSVKFITRFTDFSDNVTPYMYHCHLLHHEDDGMMGSFSVIDTNATGIKDQEFLNDIILFPNPASTKVTILTGKNLRNAEVRIVNVLGQLQETKTVSFNNNKTEIDISTLSTGIYFIELIAGNKLLTQKIIKH